MKNKRLFSGMLAAALIAMFSLVLGFGTETRAYAEDGNAVQTEDQADSATGNKAMAAGIVVGLAAAAGAIGMGIAVAKSTESMARQPEIAGKINSTMMLGMVFIETAIIYALIVAILIIFVL